MKNNIAFVSSPFQLVCLKEYVYRFNIKKLEIFFLSSTDSVVNKKQFYSAANYLDLKINCSLLNKGKLFYFKLIFLFGFKKVNNLILGDYFNSSYFILTKIIKFQNLIFVDDGLSTIFLNKKSIDTKSVVGRLFKFNYKSPFYFFSNFKNETIEFTLNNDFSYLKSTLKNKKVKDYSILLGGKFVEAGYTSLDRYLEILREVKKRSKNKIIYIPHRLENPINYDNYPFEILLPDVCFEILITQLDSLPKKILGFYTTALITGKFILSNYDQIAFINFEVDFFTDDDKKIFNEVLTKSKIENNKILS